MNKAFFVKLLIIVEILLFLSLPVIAMQYAYAYTPKPETPPQFLREENLSRVAKFKTYENSISYLSVEMSVEKEEKIETDSKQEAQAVKKEQSATITQAITPAVQSVAYAIEDVAPTVSPTETPTPKALDISNSPQSLTPEQITFLGTCEAGMDPTKNTGNGYYGAFQFSYGTWKSMNTGYERADLAPLEVQIDAVQRLLQRSSIYTQFPACARKMQALGMI